jgi:hypothetical protein
VGFFPAMKKIAILIDGEFFSIALRHDLKLAGRHGVQVVIAQIGSFNAHNDLIEDADFKRVYRLAA